MPEFEYVFTYDLKHLRCYVFIGKIFFRWYLSTRYFSILVLSYYGILYVRIILCKRIFLFGKSCCLNFNYWTNSSSLKISLDVHKLFKFRVAMKSHGGYLENVVRCSKYLIRLDVFNYWNENLKFGNISKKKFRFQNIMTWLVINF